mgnify:FL=1
MAEGIASLAREIYMPSGMMSGIMQTDESIQSGMEDLRQQDPAAFQAMMDANTEANIARLNRLQFEQDDVVAGSPMPAVDRYLAEEAVYRTQVPPGFENSQYLEKDRTTGGVNIPARPTGLTERTFVVPNAPDSFYLHEAAHSVLPEEGMMESLTAGASGREEAGVTGMDMYRAIKTGNSEELTSTVNYLARQGVNMFNPGDLIDLRNNIVERMMILSDQAGSPMSMEQVQALNEDVTMAVKAGRQEAMRLYEQSQGQQNYAMGGGVQSLSSTARDMFRR